MKLNCSRNEARDIISANLAAGYHLFSAFVSDYNKPEKKAFHDSQFQQWYAEIQGSLKEIFPTNHEWNMFYISPRMKEYLPLSGSNWWSKRERALTEYLKVLREIFVTQIDLYTDFINKRRLFVEDFDNFARVRDVNVQELRDKLDKNDRIELSEATVKRAIEDIIGQRFNQGDWGGETNDLFSSNILLNGARRQCAFFLKGRGTKIKELRIKDCGTNGDQISRLFKSPAEIFFIQYVGRISEAVIDEAETQLSSLISTGRSAAFCILEGQDTARLLHAYGFLK